MAGLTWTDSDDMTGLNCIRFLYLHLSTGKICTRGPFYLIIIQH